MSEEKEYPNYNINIGTPTQIETFIKINTYKYHPYGLEGFRKDLIEHIDGWQSKGLAWQGHDQLTHSWRTPWDLHMRYEKLMNPIVVTVMGIAKDLSPKSDWILKECWITEYINGSGASRHNHGDDTFGLSFCYYVKVPDSGPGFSLCDDVDNAMYQLNIAEGDLLIFRHPVRHQVFPAVDRRIIISGNIIFNDTDDVLSMKKYYNENLQNEHFILSASHHDVDVDDWSMHVTEQKIGLNKGY